MEKQPFFEGRWGMEDNQKKVFEEKYNERDFQKTIYSFNNHELRKLQSLDTLVQMGQMAQLMINSLVNSECLKRVNQKSSVDTGVLYDIPRGEFYVYSPRTWCDLCKNRRALYRVEHNAYCEGCVEILKKQAALQPAKKKPTSSPKASGSEAATAHK